MNQNATENSRIVPSASEFHHSETRASVSANDFLVEVPEYLAVTRRMFEELKGLEDKSDCQQRTREVYRRIQGFATTVGRAGLPVAGQIGSGLATLLKKLCDNPNTLTPSTWNTVCRAILLLEHWCVPGLEERFADQPPIRLLVVEDEPLAKRAVMGTLQQVFAKPESAGNGNAALTLIIEKPYDVIFTDVQMPLMDGFELCTMIRASELNHRTPVVFISACTDPASYARGIESGGTDFIAKPFLPIEMTVKALTFAWQARLQQLDANYDMASSLETLPNRS